MPTGINVVNPSGLPIAGRDYERKQNPSSERGWVFCILEQAELVYLFLALEDLQSLGNAKIMDL